jgi:hypothetical protein
VPEFHGVYRASWTAIEAGAYPEWELALQIFTEAQADAFSFDNRFPGTNKLSRLEAQSSRGCRWPSQINGRARGSLY